MRIVLSYLFKFSFTPSEPCHDMLHKADEEPTPPVIAYGKPYGEGIGSPCTYESLRQMSALASST